MKQFTVAVIGLGNSGLKIHCKYLSRIPQMYRVIAAADIVDERRNKAAAEYGINTYENYRVMIDECRPDIVVNTLLSSMHVPVSIELLEKGYNVICEKPLTNSMKEAVSLIDCVNRTGKDFTVFHDLRFSPHFLEVKRILESKVLGRIVQISMYADFFQRNWNWQVLKKYNGGRLMNGGSHMLDKVLVLAGEGFMPFVTCRMDKGASFGDAEDYVKMILTSPGYPLFDLEMSACCAYPPFSYNIQGTYGGLTGGTKKIMWKYFDPSESFVHKATDIPVSDDEGNPSYCREDLKWYENEWVDTRDEYDVAPIEFYKKYYNSLINNTSFEITLDQIIRQVEIIEKCLKKH